MAIYCEGCDQAIADGGTKDYLHCEQCQCCYLWPERRVNKIYDSITTLTQAAETFDAGILQTVVRGNDNQITQAIIILRGEGIQDVLDAIETVTETW